MPTTALEDAHEVSTESAPDGSQQQPREVRYPFAFKNLDWDEYHRYRPEYPDALFDVWLEYHRRHGGGFECLHDVGAGPGTLTLKLHTHFTNLIVSDPGKANLTSAQHTLTSLYPASTAATTTTNASESQTKLLTAEKSLLFLNSSAESVSSLLPPSSVDFLCVGEAFHYFDAPRAMRSFATMLKPGGTLAAVTYAFRLRFPERKECEALWYAVTNQATLRIVRGGGGGSGGGGNGGTVGEKLFDAAKRGLEKALSGLDFVKVSERWFEEGEVERWAVNVDKEDNGSRPWAFVDEDESWTPAEDNIGEKDVVRFVNVGDGGGDADAGKQGEAGQEYENVAKGWRKRVNAEWLKGFLISSQLGFGQSAWEMEEWRELERIVDGEEGREVLVEWPVAVLLATRNGRAVHEDAV